MNHIINNIHMNFDRKSQLFIIICDDIATRKKIYKYLESIGHNYRGYSNNLYPSERKFMLSKCYECGKMAKFTDDNYNYGCLDSNQDEYYCVKCRCGNIFCYEPNFDDGRIVIRRNNMIVVGDYIKTKNIEKSVNDATLVTEKDFEIILKELKTFTLPFPTKNPQGKNLEKYIKENL